MIRPLPALCLVVILSAGPVWAQPTRTLASDDWCDSAWSEEGRRTACEVRETVLPAGSLAVDGRNGGISVRPWDRSDVLVRARVIARGRTQSEAAGLLRSTALDVGRGSIGARARGRGAASVSVDYEVFAPPATALTLRTTNGGVAVERMRGEVDAQTTNGGITLQSVAGAVRARTQNGGIQLGVAAGQNRRLDLRTVNGGIAIDLPPGYGADLVASTRMGRIATSGLDIRGEQREPGRTLGDRVEARIGRGGPTLSAVTTNGGITVRGSR